MKKLISAPTLITVIVLSTAWAGWKLLGQRPRRPVAGSFHRSKVNSFGHTRGIVQVNLMRRLMAEQIRSTPPAPDPGAGQGHLMPSQDHPLLGRRAPAFTLKDARGMTWNLGEEVSKGPVVIVFYLGSTCTACVAHLVELDVAISRFDERGARVLAVSGDSPEFSMERIRKFGGFRIPLLSDPDHAISSAYGAWKPIPGGDEGDGEALHGSFVVERDGLIRWAYLGNRPFDDIEAILTELAKALPVRISSKPTSVR